MDVSVSCDSTWQRRGYSSNNSIVSVISVDSGKNLAREVMNKVCKACSMKEKMRLENPTDCAEWKTNHVCSFNYQGTAR